jgi:hypothetical protein
VIFAIRKTIVRSIKEATLQLANISLILSVQVRTTTN